MSTYAPLRDFLSARAESRVQATFSELERVIGQDLPASARKHRPWWGNDRGRRHPQAVAWLDAGFEVSAVDLVEELVTFARAHRNPALETFAGQTKAHLIFARGLPDLDAKAVIEHHLGEGTWTEDPYEWVETLCLLEQRDRISSDAANGLVKQMLVRVAAVDELTEGLCDGLVHLSLLAQSDRRDTRVTAVARTVTSIAGPGDANVVADLASDRVMSTNDDAAVVYAEWMLGPGTAELRNPKRINLLHFCLMNARTPDQLVRAIHLLHRSPGGLSITRHPVDGYRALWDRTESPDVSDHDRWTLLERLALDGSSIEHIYPRPEHHPRAIGVLRRAWVGNRGGLRHSSTATKVVLAAPPTPEMFEDASLTDLCGVAERSVMSFMTTGACEQWTELLAGAVLRASGGPKQAVSDATTEHALQMISGLPRPAEGTRRALRAALAGAEHPLVGQLLDAESVDAHWRVRAALAALGGGDTTTRQGTSPALPEAYLHQLRLLLADPSHRKCHGVDLDQVFRGARDVRFDVLPNGLAFELHDGVLVVDRDYPESLLRSQWSHDEQLILLSVYVVHELIHDLQRARGPDVIVRLRATGQERALMDIDLSADHAAATLVASANPRWSLLGVKDIQARSIVEFPIKPTHGYGSRIRKTHRFVGARVDYLLRRNHSSCVDLADGYASVAWGPAPGPLFVFASGPPFRVVLGTSVTEAQARVLRDSLKPDRSDAPVPRSDPVQAVDDVLTALLAPLSKL